MTNAGKAFYQFFSSFGIPAYEENSVPDNAALPYITYTPQDTDWREPTSVSASIWYKGTGLSELFAKVDEIKKKVGEGLRIPIESGGCVWIYKDSPFAQIQAAEIDNVKMAYLLFGVHVLCD